MPFPLAVFLSLAAAPEQATFQQYCLGCHNPKTKSGGISLDPASQTPELLEKAVKRLRARHMPPPGVPRPSDSAYEAVIASLESSLDRLSLNPGRTDTFRRLNRTEYRNAIRDLLHLDVDVSALLPHDDSAHGFDHITVSNLSPTLLERYLNAARKISRLALGVVPKSPGGETYSTPPDLTQEKHLPGFPQGTRGGLRAAHNFPTDGEYEIVVRLARDRNEHVEGIGSGRHQVEILLDGARVSIFTVQPPPSGEDHQDIDKHVRVRIPVIAGPHEVAATFIKRPSTLIETERQPYESHFNMDRHPRPQPAVYQISINGPFHPSPAGDTPSRRRIFICKTQDDACAKRILANLMRRAYRRPVTPADLAKPLLFYKQGGMEMALSAILVSPEFLFRVEQDPANIPPGATYQISELELASRLSFFLWSSIPDDELLDAAEKGALRLNLETHVRRMWKDPRSRALIDNFAAQWLQLRNLASVQPDMRAFPGFDDNLRQAFRTETEQFVESILREDRPILDLLSADHTFVNERLAKHYGIPHIYGSHFRRVIAPHRGGLLSHGSILTVTSYATRTSPVLRGKWIMENLLGVPPPPPPAEVPKLRESASAAASVTMRERMAEHRQNPACAGCHKLIDPPGFALENYDGVGRWRTHDGGKRVDASGELPDGARFDGVDGLRKALLARPDLFVSAFTGKLLTYGLGRGVEYYDAPAIRKIVRDAARQNYRFSSFIIGVVRSAPFQMRRSSAS